MSITVETKRLPGSRVEIQVAADEQEVEKAFDRAYNYLSREAKIPGFRPGKAPRQVLERRFDAETVREIAWHEFVERSYAPALEEQELKPLGQPEVPPLDDVEGFEPGSGATITSTMVVHPEPVLPDYDHLKLVQASAEVSEEDIDEQILELRRAQAKTEVVEREKIEQDDLVKAHVVVSDPEQEEPLEEYDADFRADGESENELEQRLVGANPEETLEYDLELGEDQQDEALAGKTVQVKATIEEVKEETLPELDDAFAADVDEELTSVEELREWLRERLSEQFAAESERALRSLALAVVDRGTELELPDELVRNMATSEVQQFMQQLQSEGLTADQAMNMIRDEDSGIMQRAAYNAVGALRTHYILEALAEVEEIEVEEADIQQAMEKYAQEHGMELESLQQMVMMQPEAEQQFEEQARRAKIIDMLLETAEVEEVGREGYPLRVRRLMEELETPEPGVVVEEVEEKEYAEASEEESEEEEASVDEEDIAEEESE
jgi:trigger factor